MKRLLPVVAVVAALLAGCGTAPAAPPAATRTVTDLLGPVDVPVAPHRGDRGGVRGPGCRSRVAGAPGRRGARRAGPGPPGHDITEPTVSLSAEELPTVDADHLVYFYWGYTGDPVALTGNPLWPTLRAVAAGHAHEIDGQAWTVPVPAAIRIMLDDVERALL